MPSPFPGMAPYLEDAGLWPDVHHGLISEIQAELNQRLRPKYHVRVEERVYISDENDPGRSVIVPDLHVAVRPGREQSLFDPKPGIELDVAEPIVVTTLIEEEIHEARLEIVDRDARQVVTVIEVVSPSNKIAGSRGRASFEQKRQEVMHSLSHWVEIDLLRTGLSLVLRERVAPCDYLVHVSEQWRRPRGLLWQIHLPQRLPRIRVPLRPDDPAAVLDLQAVLDRAYDRAAYDLVLDYRSEPVPPLSEMQARWADRLLKQKGLRPA